MSLNREDIILDKSKVVIMRLDKMYVVIPFTITKIEVRTRNIIINQRKKIEGLARYI